MKRLLKMVLIFFEGFDDDGNLVGVSFIASGSGYQGYDRNHGWL